LAVDIPHPKKQVGVLPHVGVFLTYGKRKTPLTFEVFFSRTSGLPSTLIFLHVKRMHVPVVPDTDRFKLTTIVENKIFYLAVKFGYSEHVGSMVIPSIVMSGAALGLPPIELEQMTLFVPADSIEVVNKNIFLRIVLYIYQAMKNLFFGSHRTSFPSQYTVYIASVASL